MDEKLKYLVGRVKEELVRRYGRGIDRVLLYGSQARGEAEEGSDIDLLVVVDESLDAREVRRSLNDLLLEILLEEGELVSVIVVPRNTFDHYNSPLLVNIRREGVAV